MRIRGSFTQILLDWMNRYGYEDQELITRVQHISQADWVNTERWKELLNLAFKLSGNPAVGIEIGSSVMVQHAGVLGYLMLNSSTLAEALETYILCEKHFYDVNFGQLSRSDNGWSLNWSVSPNIQNTLFDQVSLSALITFLRQRFPGSCKLGLVSFTFEEPLNRDIYEDFFDCAVQFNSSVTGLVFEKNTIHQPAKGTLSGDFQRMRNYQLQAFDQVIRIEDPFLQRLQHVILSLLPEGKAKLPDIAQSMNCSTRTIQRKLVAYGLSFQDLLDGVREQLAYRYVQGSSLSLSEIAQLLGFSDQSAFTRAFKCWTGQTPTKIRAITSQFS